MTASTNPMTIASKLPGCDPDQAFEPAREMTLVCIADSERDLGDRDSADNQVARPSNACRFKIRVWRQADTAFEHPREIERTEIDDRSHFRQ